MQKEEEWYQEALIRIKRVNGFLYENSRVGNLQGYCLVITRDNKLFGIKADGRHLLLQTP